MNTIKSTEPQVTIIVAPRERFSFTQDSLESIYEHTDYPFSLVYIDGGSPSHIQQYLHAQANEKKFNLIRTDYYLSPNQSRNLGLSHVDQENSKYIVFIDNDVIVTPGWLKQLVKCAEETSAAVVGPLTCIGNPEDQIIHNPGGKTYIKEEQIGETVRRSIYQKAYFNNRPIVDVAEQIKRTKCDYVEFHCMLVRTNIFEQTGFLDEGLLSTREHLDFCMNVSQAGGTIYCERETIVTYVPGSKLKWSDLPFFMLRWSDAWDLASLAHFSKKWNLTEDKYFTKRYKKLGFRRRKGYIKPLSQQLTFGKKSYRLENFLVRLDKPLNRYISTRYDKKKKSREPIAKITTMA